MTLFKFCSLFRDAKVFVAGNEVLAGSNPSDFSRYIHLLTEHDKFTLDNVCQDVGYREGMIFGVN